MNSNNIEITLEKLKKSKFRNSFNLKEKDIKYAKEKGYKEIEKHTKDFIYQRLSPKNPKNDGKQTPMKGHPTFIAQHATATCCRSCLEKWHKIPKNKELTKQEQEYIVKIIMTWITKQVLNNVNKIQKSVKKTKTTL